MRKVLIFGDGQIAQIMHSYFTEDSDLIVEGFISDEPQKKKFCNLPIYKRNDVIKKFDINEEMIRLKSHILLFKECINSDTPIGKKIGFICQEIGREINTIGSKANDAELQKNVIEMKDNLEKIKENILNIL